MGLDDYLTAVDFKAYGVPPAEEWVDELRDSRGGCPAEMLC